MKHPGFVLAVVISAFLLVLSSWPASALDFNGIDEADAWVVTTFPNDNFGLGINVHVGKDVGGAAERRAFLYFNLTGAPIDNETVNITYAHVVLWKESHNVGFPASAFFSMSPVTANWFESTITWNNQPSIGTGSSLATVTQANTSFTWNVTDIYNAWAAQNFTNNYGLRLSLPDTPPINTVADFTAREGTNASRRPYLIVNYTVFIPSPPPGPTPAVFNDWLWGYMTVFAVGVIITILIAARNFKRKGGL